MKTKPIAVLISDIHFNMKFLDLATKSLLQAVNKANTLGVPLIIAGDMHDTKANMRAECINAINQTLFYLGNPRDTKGRGLMHTVLVGNHDMINEKSDGSQSALSFLQQNPKLIVIGRSVLYNEHLKVYFIGYRSNADQLREELKVIPKGSTLIMHQGIVGSNSGEYIQDKSAITKDDVAGFRVISGHYHTRQTIDLPDGGKWDYIGNPYTTNYGEANDPEKGFQILMKDGSLEFVPTNLRKHVVLNLHATAEGTKGFQSQMANKDDLVWVKVTGTKEQLLATPPTKSSLCYLIGVDNIKLDILPTDTETKAPDNKQELTQAELLDSMIDSLTNTGDDIKMRLKSKWKDLK